MSDTKKDKIVEDINGIKISDPYRWLEDLDSKETKKWINEHNLQIDKELKTGSFEDFSSELEKNLKTLSYSDPVKVGDKYFYTERQPDEDQFVLYMKKDLNAEPIKLIDPNGIKDGNTITIDYWSPSKTGKYLVYGLSEGGDEMATLYIKDLDTNENLDYKIVNCRYSDVRWLSNDSGFFYTRNPRPGEVSKNEEHLHIKVYFHKLGDNPDNDELIFGKDRPKDDMTNISISPDDRYLSIQVTQSWTQNDVYIYDINKKEIKPLAVSIPNKFSVKFLRDKILLDTNYKANNYRILYSTYEDFSKPLDEWQEFIAEKDNLLQKVRVTKDKILVEYLVNACSEVLVFDHDGKETGKLPIPKYSSLAGVSGSIFNEEFFFGVVSFTFPKISYRYDPEIKKYSEYRKIDNPINPDEYEVKQEWYKSKDGTKVPMFIVHKKDIKLDGENPTVLYGYGGFSINQTPHFSKGLAPWIERGGIFVIANIRGGAEFGEEWHLGGTKENKQNSFDDFISAGEHLISQKYTNGKHLGILGGSNGGLLVSVVGVQRPDLFNAICSQVPLTDMVRFYKFGIAIRWIHEYGDPRKLEDLKNILKWSPYHNVESGIDYSNFLFMTADKDTRVDPLHARKMAAILEENKKDNEIFIFTEKEAGHGPGKPVAKIVEGQAIVLSFFDKYLR